MEVNLGYHPMRMPTQGSGWGGLEGGEGKWVMALPFRAWLIRERSCAHVTPGMDSAGRQKVQSQKKSSRGQSREAARNLLRMACSVPS